MIDVVKRDGGIVYLLSTDSPTIWFIQREVSLFIVALIDVVLSPVFKQTTHIPERSLNVNTHNNVCSLIKFCGVEWPAFVIVFVKRCRFCDKKV